MNRTCDWILTGYNPLGEELDQEDRISLRKRKPAEMLIMFGRKEKMRKKSISLKLVSKCIGHPNWREKERKYSGHEHHSGQSF